MELTLSQISSTQIFWLAALFILSLRTINYYRSGLQKIPTVGHSGLLSYITAVQWITKANDLLKEGYEKYYGRAFKVATPDKWMVMVSGPQMIEDIRRAPDDELSFMESSGDALQTIYTMGPSIHNDPYHADVVRGIMTRSLGLVFPDVRDEIVNACNDLIPVKDEWVKIPALETIQKIVCRTSNRLFVGLPLCRDPDYIALNIEFTVDVVKAAAIINLFPDLLKPFVARFLTSVPQKIQRGIRHLEPIITHRLEQQEAHGKDYPGKPVDMLSWIIEQADGDRGTVRELTLRILTLNFAAIHTTSMSFTSALYYLAQNPELAKPLREELDSVIEEHGWSKASMDKLSKMDSFLKEAQRLMGLGNIALSRKVLKDFTFSDGTTLPAGSSVSVPAMSIHYDENYYPNAPEFQAMRFHEMKDPSAPLNVKHQMVTTSPEYLLFGHGRHACPGRFFAVNELKIVLSHILMTFDVKFEDEGKFPPPSWFGTALVPNPKAKVMFRARKL